jgi:phospholipid/cholesterol/gamma-HCH transport system substrate-binding protein
MGNKLNYALVGLFVLLLGAAWLAISLWLALGDFRTDYTSYHVFMNESVSGLYIDAPVKYRGVEIGKVRDIALNPLDSEQVQLTLDIESSAPIKEDTIAVLAVQGLTGIAFVELKGGSKLSPLLEEKEGDLYPVIRSGPSFFARLDTSGTELVANMSKLANRLGELLDDEGRQKIRGVIDDTGKITAALARQDTEIGESVVNASKLFEHGVQLAEQLQPLLLRIETTARAFEQMANRISETSASVDQYVQQSSSGVQQFTQQTLPEIGGLVSELRRLADTLQSIGQKLEEDPRVLLYGRELEMPGPGE